MIRKNLYATSIMLMALSASNRPSMHEMHDVSAKFSGSNGSQYVRHRKTKNQRHFELKKKRNRKMNKIQRKSRQQNR